MIYPVQARPRGDGQPEPTPLEMPRLLGQDEPENAAAGNPEEEAA
jgi:hypothetical protein